MEDFAKKCEVKEDETMGRWVDQSNKNLIESHIKYHLESHIQYYIRMPH